MKLHFKFKIALLSLLLSGALLTAFGIAFFSFFYRTGLGRIDQELRSLAESSLHGARPSLHWEDFDHSLQFIYGDTNASRIAIRVTEYDDLVVFESDNAPLELQELTIPDWHDRPKYVTENTFTRRLDRNEDNRVSPQEFDGPDEDFQRFDTDGDGFITTEEAPTSDRPPQDRSAQGPRPQREQSPEGSSPPPKGPRPKQKLPVADPPAPVYQTIQTSNGNWRTGIFLDPQLRMVIAMDMDEFYADIDQFRTTIMIAIPLGLLLLGASGWYLAGRAMKPVALIADTAEGITAKELNQRIPSVGNDIELERLVHVTNSMLDRLEKSYHQAVRFSADAAHELQTPLTILQGELDNAIQTSADGSEEQQRYSTLLEELRNLKGVVQKLLLLAHADEGRLKLNTQSVNMSELIRDAAEDIEIMAPGIQIETTIPDGISLQADPALINQAIRNMISNAAKYSDAGGCVVFNLEKTESEIRFTLSNTASAIPEKDQTLLFERFHRVEKSRTTTGSGLGLSLAREITRAHNGKLILNPYADGMVSFTLTLPI